MLTTERRLQLGLSAPFRVFRDLAAHDSVTMILLPRRGIGGRTGSFGLYRASPGPEPRQGRTRAGARPVQGRPGTGVGQGLIRRCLGLGARELPEQSGGRGTQGRPDYRAEQIR